MPDVVEAYAQWILSSKCEHGGCRTCGGRGFIEGIGGRQVFCPTRQADPQYQGILELAARLPEGELASQAGLATATKGDEHA